MLKFDIFFKSETPSHCKGSFSGVEWTSKLLSETLFPKVNKLESKYWNMTRVYRAYPPLTHQTYLISAIQDNNG